MNKINMHVRLMASPIDSRARARLRNMARTRLPGQDELPIPGDISAIANITAPLQNSNYAISRYPQSKADAKP